jgi:hypothetical protein
MIKLKKKTNQSKKNKKNKKSKKKKKNEHQICKEKKMKG